MGKGAATGYSGAMTPQQLVLVEDDPRWIQAVRDAVGERPDYCLTRVYTSAAAVCVDATERERLWLIDLGLPGGISGLDLIAPVVDSGGRVLVMTVFEDETRVVAAIQAGANGYHVKGEGNLLASIDELNAGLAPLSPKIATHVLRVLRRHGPVGAAETENTLSPREMQTLQALAHGYSYREVARKHRVSHHTVGDHVKSIYKKLHVNSKTAAINAALKRGILHLDEV